MFTRLYQMFVNNFSDEKSGVSGGELYNFAETALFAGVLSIVAGFLLFMFGTRYANNNFLSLDNYAEVVRSAKFVGRLLCYGGITCVAGCFLIIRFQLGFGKFASLYPRYASRNSRNDEDVDLKKALIRGLGAAFWLVLGMGASLALEMEYPLGVTNDLVLLLSFVLFCGTISLASNYAIAIAVGKMFYISVIVVVAMARSHYGSNMSIVDLLKSDYSIAQDKEAAVARVIEGKEYKGDRKFLGRIHSDAERIRLILSKDTVSECGKTKVEALKERIKNAIEKKPTPVSIPGCDTTSDYWVQKREAAVAGVLAGNRYIADENTLGRYLPDVVEVGRLRTMVRNGEHLSKCESRRRPIVEERVSQFIASGKYDAQALRLVNCPSAPPPPPSVEDESPVEIMQDDTVTEAENLHGD